MHTYLILVLSLIISASFDNFLDWDYLNPLSLGTSFLALHIIFSWIPISGIPIKTFAFPESHEPSIEDFIGRS